MARDKEKGRKGKQSKGQQKEPAEAAMAEKRPNRDTDSSDSDSGPDDRSERPSKVLKSGNSGARKLKNEEGSTYFELDRNRRVTVREFKNKIYVDIREFYEKDGKILPGKKGISLNATQWNKLKTLIDDVDDEVQQLA